MKIAPLALCLVLFSAPAWSAAISAAEAIKHVGETATVEGVVTGLRTSRAGNTFLTMGRRYPHNIFSILIPRKNVAAVGDVSGLDGKTVAVTGFVEIYRNKAEIIVRKRSQIVVK